MTSTLLVPILVVSAIACTLVAGVFQAFSEFVMKALAETAPTAGIGSMQWINRKVFRTGFVAMLIGMAVVSPILMSIAWLHTQSPVSLWIIGGASLYLLGTFLVTLVFNVPLNKRLDVVDADSAEAHTFWPDYVRYWTFWNHVRGLASLAAGVCFLVAALSLK